MNKRRNNNASPLRSSQERSVQVSTKERLSIFSYKKLHIKEYNMHKIIYVRFFLPFDHLNRWVSHKGRHIFFYPIGQWDSNNYYLILLHEIYLNNLHLNTKGLYSLCALQRNLLGL